MPRKNTPVMSHQIVMVSINDLLPYENNARTHSDEQIAHIASSILDFGFTNPVLIDSEHGIIAGHGRVLGAKKLGLDEVPVVVLDHLTPEQKKAYIIADNKLAEEAGWDKAILASELNELRELDFDLEDIGFTAQELEELYSSLHEANIDANCDSEEDIPEAPEKSVTIPGQLWTLGKHKLLCADACKAESFKILLDDELAQMTFTDPPYNINYKTLPTDKDPDGKRKRSTEQLIANDNLHDNFSSFLNIVCKQIIRFTQGACYICMAGSEFHTLHQAFTSNDGCCSNVIIWVKNHFTMGYSDYRHQYEMILYGWRNNHDRFWSGKRDQSDVWEIDKEPKNTLHPTMKPVALCERAISNSSKTGDIVLDCFGGSGSTLMACQRLHRQARVMELEPKYVDVMIKRWQKATGMDAVDTLTGKTFNTLLLEQTNNETSELQAN